jgi:uncharacterized damage-inducible protein DinB
MTNAQDYRRIFSYNEKVLRAFFDTLSNVPRETVAKNSESAHYSMKNTFVHILSVYNGWINCNALGKSSEIPWAEHDYDNYQSIEQVKEFMVKVLTGVDAFMERLDDNALSKRMEGEHELRDVLMQVTFEQAHHLGEIIALLWQSDIEPPEMTWIMNTQ